MPKRRKTELELDVDDYHVEFEVEREYGGFGDWDVTVTEPPTRITHLEDGHVVAWTDLTVVEQESMRRACWHAAHDEFEAAIDRAMEPPDED